MRRGLALLWGGTVLPFALTAINGGPDGWLPHALFHPLWVGFLAVAVVGARRVVRATRARTVRWPARGVVLAVVVTATGHLLEEVAVFQHGGLHAEEDVFETPLHLLGSVLALPGILVAMALTVAASVAAALTGTAGRRVERWIRIVHRWTSVAFVGALVVMVWDERFAPAFFAALILLLLTGLQMSGRHYLNRWRRRRARGGTPVPPANPLAERAVGSPGP